MKRKSKQRKPYKVSSRNLAASSKPSKIGLTLAVISLVLTAIGLVALIELYPRLSATAASPTDPDDPLTSSKFTVSNDGYLKVTDIVSACFLWRAGYGTHDTVDAKFSSYLAENVSPPESKLVPTEGFTVPCTGHKVVDTAPPYIPLRLMKADLAIVVYYRFWPFTFHRTRRLFRFVARTGGRNEIVWEKQPSGVIEPDFDRFIESYGGHFPVLIPKSYK